MSRRDRIALRKPIAGANLTRFPASRWPSRFIELFRAHSTSFEVWWFSSDMTGRFDLADPSGTCYLANEPGAALRERLGARLSQRGFATRETLGECRVSRLRNTSGAVPPKTANLDHKHAVNFRVTREIHSTERYDITQAWAAALHAAGFGAVRYAPRFSTAKDAVAVGLFDQAGGLEPVNWRGWDVSEAFTGEQAAVLAGMTIVDRPKARSLTVARTPHGRGRR